MIAATGDGDADDAVDGDVDDADGDEESVARIETSQTVEASADGADADEGHRREADAEIRADCR